MSARDTYKREALHLHEEAFIEPWTVEGNMIVSPASPVASFAPANKEAAEVLATCRNHLEGLANCTHPTATLRTFVRYLSGAPPVTGNFRVFSSMNDAMIRRVFDLCRDLVREGA